MGWASSITALVAIGLTLDSPAAPMTAKSGCVALRGVMRLRGGFPGQKILKKLSAFRNGESENGGGKIGGVADKHAAMMDWMAQYEAGKKKEDASGAEEVATRKRYYLQLSSGVQGLGAADDGPRGRNVTASERTTGAGTSKSRK